jgi:hypothetical protein
VAKVGTMSQAKTVAGVISIITAVITVKSITIFVIRILNFRIFSFPNTTFTIWNYLSYYRKLDVLKLLNA